MPSISNILHPVAPIPLVSAITMSIRFLKITGSEYGLVVMEEDSISWIIRTRRISGLSISPIS
jgi:hypothetical protein